MYEVTEPGTIDVSLCDPASFDTSLVVYTGTNCGSLTQIACNGDDEGQGGCQPYYSAVQNLSVDTGTQVYIRIGGWKGAFGPGTCTLTFHPEDSFGACCILDDCMILPEPSCGDAGGYWYPGTNCDLVTCQSTWQPCSTGTGVDPLPPGGPWTVYTSDAGAGIIRAAAIQAPSVAQCVISGLAMVYDGGWSPCSAPATMSMKWTLYSDEGGVPGPAIASGTDTQHTPWDLVYSDLYQLQGWSFEPSAASPADWIGLQSLSSGQGSCWFLWMAGSDDGSGAHAYRHTGEDWSIESTDLNYCITP
jgi:hypothetical protein